MLKYLLWSTQRVEQSHGWRSRKYPQFNGHPGLEHNWDFMGREIIRVMPVARNDLIRALRNFWLNTTVPYLHNLYNSLPRRVRAVIRQAGLPHKILINKVFSQIGQYFNMSHFSWKKYPFAANYRDDLTFLTFDVKQRLIWHLPGVASFCQGSAYWPFRYALGFKGGECIIIKIKIEHHRSFYWMKFTDSR